MAISSRSAAPGAGLTAGLVLAGFGIGVLLCYLAYQAYGPGEWAFRAALACWTSVPYVIAGALAWRRRPESRVGVLMVATGFVTMLSFLHWSSSDLLFILADAVDFAPPVMFLWLFLAYPDGVVTDRLDRTALGLAVVAVALTPLYVVLGYGGDRNLLQLTVAPSVVETLQAWQLLLMSVALLIGVASLARRRLRERRPVRAWSGHLVDSFVLVLVMLAFLYLVHLTGIPVSTDGVRLAVFVLVGIAPGVFLFGLLQARLGAVSVATLIRELEADPEPATLERAVAKALRDPSARLVYWVPEFDAHVDASGKEVSVEPVPGRAVTPVLRDGQQIALLIHDAGLNDEPELLSSVATATGLSIENARLQVELRARLEELRGSRIRILAAEETERRRLERDLHDGAQQRLIALSIELGELGERVAEDPELARRVAASRREVTASLAELRGIAHGIHPAAIVDHGLEVAIESLTTRSPLPVRRLGRAPDSLPQNVAVTAYYLISECLANAAKHSQATSVTIEVVGTESSLVIEVVDDGIGGASTDRGSGLRGLADRVEALDGRLRVWSPVGGGTRVRAELPCAP